jgi:hypothetical protein
MQGGRVVWMQAKKVEKDGSDLANVKLRFRSRATTTTTTTLFHERNFGQNTRVRRDHATYVFLSDNGYLSLQFRLIMPVPSRPMTSDRAVT